jgi:hypothetical protein
MGVSSKISGHFFRLNDFLIDNEIEKFYITCTMSALASDFLNFSDKNAKEFSRDITIGK